MKRLNRSVDRTLANESLALSFDGKTGELRSIRNLATGNEYLQLPAAGGNLFAVYHDFTGLFDVTSPRGGTPRVAVEPASITKSVFGPRQTTAVSFSLREGKSAKRLTVTYRGPVWKADLTFTVAAKSPVVECDMTLTNTDTIPASCLCVFPFLSGIKLGSGRRTRMVSLVEAGYVRPLWCDHEGGIYGNAAQMSMQWGSVFDPDSGDALGFIVRDAELENKDIRYRKPSIEVRYFPPRTLFPGQTVRLPRAALLVYSGDWKPTADAYHRWFTRAFPPVKQPPWIASLDSHLGQWFRKRKPGDKPVGEGGLGNRLRSFEDLPEVYRRLPVSCIEFAFHCEGSSRLHLVGGEPRPWHTDGDNVLRSDLGGARALKKGVHGTHGLGMHFTFYVEGYIVPFDADLIAKGGALAWTVMNRDGTSLGSYTREGFVHMCPGCAEWQDHLARTAARLVRDTGADGVRLDSLGYYFYPCYNPAHHHRSPWDYNRWMDQLLGKVARAVRAVKRDCLLSTETGVDFYARHFNGALTQQGHGREVIAVTDDVAPMRVALPEYYMIPHNPCGPLAAALMGYPGGSGGTSAGGRMTELDKLWRSVRFAAARTIRWGSASRPNPKATRADVQCRVFSEPKMDVVIGARPDLRRKATDFPESGRGTYLNGDIDTRKDRFAYAVSVDTAGRSPTAAYVYDVETLRLGVARVAVQKGHVNLATRSNWFMAVLCYGKAPIATSIEVSAPLTPGKRCTLRIWAFGPDGVIPVRGGPVATGTLWVPGLGLDGGGREVSIPSELTLTIPKGTRSGSYVCTLSGPGLLGCMRFLSVG